MQQEKLKFVEELGSKLFMRVRGNLMRENSILR